MINTRDLSNFGYRELDLLKDLLTAMINSGLPDDFYDDGVVPEFNPISGNVFLVNSDYQVAVEQDGKLVSFYVLGWHGNEGTLEELIEQFDDGDIKLEDMEELAEICERNNMSDKAKEIMNKYEKEVA